MVRILLFVTVSVMVFVGGLATSYILIVRPNQATPQVVEFTELAPAIATEVPSPVPAELPTVVREQPLSPEELFRYSSLYQKQQEVLDQQRQALEERKQRLQLMEEDMRRARLELDGLRQQSADAVKRGEALLQQIQQERHQRQLDQQELDKKMQQTQKSSPISDESTRENVKQVSRWFQGMPAERAAEYLQELANDGKLMSAAELLSHMEERDAAKVLAAVPDAGLVVQLTEEFKKMKRPVKIKR